mmetsp:Transcript_6972/g.12748  ORF Transcript_6972/g.12748 Transcript_6972/m.12748 type:complete len:112 (-) Transcript_6972:4212-4547(-)
MGCQSSQVLPERFMTQEMRELQFKFELTNAELMKMWKIFLRIDVDKSNTIRADEIFLLIKELPTSIIAPYLIIYISDLEKEQGDRLNFFEFTRCIGKYCLLTPTQLLQCTV